MIDDVGEKYCSVNEVCLTEVSFVTSTYEVVHVTRRCASKESNDECHAVNAQGNFLNFLYHNIKIFKFLKLYIFSKVFVLKCLK